eukprot:CAMPEP_0184731964 /NCGR_PEP_ID=MMETSP0314-20130426/52706_1 /TAXON_ID=38298 /ORGANISM="Rhodella maculata, Strain CCMP 736" /LENGTH=65 /DNA_ID=CAMNT_0027198445 /DNA_START=31 /DNA_END=224 /DNA_ORIENTATION=-
MKKVGPSIAATGETDERACLLITQAGRFPSKDSVYIGRLLDSSAKPPPKSFKPKALDKKSDMIPR